MPVLRTGSAAALSPRAGTPSSLRIETAASASGTPGPRRIFGYRAAEMEGQTLDLIIPEALRARHNEGFRRVMATGESRYAADLLAVPGLRQDGARISLEFTITLIKDDHGQVLGAAAIMRDVTARWQREKELTKRLAVLEGQGQA